MNILDYLAVAHIAGLYSTLSSVISIYHVKNRDIM